MPYILWFKIITSPFTSPSPQLSPALASMGDFSTSRRPRSAKVCVKLRSASCQQNRTSTGDPRNPRHNSVNSFEVLQPHLREKKKETTGFDVLSSWLPSPLFPPSHPAGPTGSPASSSNSHPGWRPSRPGRRSGTAPHRPPASSRRGPPWCDERCGHSLLFKRWQAGKHQNSGNTRLTKSSKGAGFDQENSNGDNGNRNK